MSRFFHCMFILSSNRVLFLVLLFLEKTSYFISDYCQLNVRFIERIKHHYTACFSGLFILRHTGNTLQNCIIFKATYKWKTQRALSENLVINCFMCFCTKFTHHISTLIQSCGSIFRHQERVWYHHNKLCLFLWRKHLKIIINFRPLLQFFYQLIKP